MSISFVFPGGKSKALTFSYDDGCTFDRRLVEIFNRYGMKSTFNLNSGKMHDDEHVAMDEAAGLYRGHEIAAHCATHGNLIYLPREDVVEEVRSDRYALETVAKRPVTGMAYPYGTISDWLCHALDTLGIEYSRTTRSTNNFSLPEDFRLWDPTCHHNSALALIDSFIDLPVWSKLPLFYIWGHSYEFDRQDNWELIEDICTRLAGRDDIWYATNGEICHYINAVRSLRFGVAGRFVTNPSATGVWIRRADGTPLEIPGGATLQLAD
ncbi:MAG: polysaccharide deacetylase family protein [Victivallaceae bacterium]|nr:polysaccharide deacetylase family protein [Victivallaceae bacterium]